MRIRHTPVRRFWKLPSADGSVQATIVIVFCQLLHYPLRLINQPKVIAEVIGGIILGPSVMMRIPGFQQGASVFILENKTFPGPMLTVCA